MNSDTSLCGHCGHPDCPECNPPRRRVRFTALRDANLERQKEYGESAPHMSLSYWGNAIAGEVGEVCNVLKKLEREAMGLKGSRDTVEHLAEELADVRIYMDLLEAKMGIDIDAAIVRKFNATSEKLGMRTRMVL